MTQKILFTLLLLSSLFIFSCGDSEDPAPTNTTLPTVSLDALDVLEGDANKSIFASIRLSKAANAVVTVTIVTEDGTAKAGSDYIAISETIDFQIGSVQENIRLEILGDDESELDEKFKLKIVDATGATISNGTLEVTIENDDLGSGNFIIPSTGYLTPDEYAGMNLIWSDEFEADKLNEEFWTYEIGNGNWGWGNNELEFYKKENTSLVDGFLVIEALKESFNGFDYTSSRLITKDKFEFKYGRVDIRAVVPEGQGIWPALWMLGANISDVSWPRCGEIDIMELVGHEPSKVHATVHYANSNGDHMPPQGASTSLSGGKKFSQNFHVFSLVWEEDSMKFYLDDNLYFSASRQTLGTQNPYPFNDPFFFIFNVAVGGNWPGSPDASTVFPQHMIVDYVRVFQN